MKWSSIPCACTALLVACGGSGGPSEPQIVPDHHDELVIESIPFDAVGPNKIVFQRDAGPVSGIVIIDGSTKTASVTYSARGDLNYILGKDLAAAPGGSRIAFRNFTAFGNKDRGEDVFIRDISATTATELGGEGPERREPSWTPDGSQIVFTQGKFPVGAAAIFVQQAAIGAPKQLLVSADQLCESVNQGSLNSHRDLLLVYSPPSNPCNGSRPTIAVKPHGLAMKIIQDPATESVRSAVRSPVWSPDGNEIAFIDALIPPAGSVVQLRLNIVAPDGTNRRTFELGQSVLFATASLCWARDGSRLFVSYQETLPSMTSPYATGHIFSIRPDGTGLTAIPTKADVKDEWVSCA